MALKKSDNHFERLLAEMLDSTKSRVCVLYRKNARGEYIPVFWMPDGQEPARVASASDLASRLRMLHGQFLEMSISTYKDGAVRRSMESYGISTIASMPLQGTLRERYFLTAGKDQHYTDLDRDALASCARELSSLLETADLSARIRGAVNTKPNDVEENHSLLERAAESGSFQELADLARDTLDLPGCVIAIEDQDGMLLAKRPMSDDWVPTFQWLSDPSRLPYLDWMEDSHRPVFVPDPCDQSGEGRFIFPLFGRKNYHGLFSVYPISSVRVIELAPTLSELKYASLYLIRCHEASRGHILRRSLDSVENERARISIELHNETSQNLVALKVRLATAQHALDKGAILDVSGLLDDCSRIADEVIGGVNRLSADLRPNELSYLGLRQAIEAAAETQLHRTGAGFSIKGNATDIHFSPLQESMLLSGVVEALSNCARHSRATHVEVEMHDDGSWLTIAVRDDGRGFNVSSSMATGVGIKSMHDCADAIGGHLWIGSTPDAGTTVRFSVPVTLLEEAGGE